MVALAAATCGTAGAHAWLVRSAPAYGDSVQTPPSTLTLEFTEGVSRALTRVAIVGAHVGVIRPAAVTKAGAATIVVRLPKLRPDLYQLDWRTVADGDLHATSGRVVFGVGTAAPAAPANGGSARDPGASWVEVLLRWEDFAAIAALIGALGVLLHVVPGAARRGAGGLDAATRPLLWLALAGCAASLLTGFGLLAAQLNRSSAGLGRVLGDTGYGHAWLAREGILALLTGALVALLRSPRNRALRFAAAVLGLGIVAPLALVSHAASAKGSLSVATGVLAVHLLAAAMWVGGVGAVCLAVADLLRAGERASARTLARSFGGLAAVSVALIGITGIGILGVHVRSLQALVSSAYGAAIVAKTVLFVVAGALGLATTVGLRARRSPALLRSAWLRAPRLEATLLFATLIPAALLVASAPPRAASPRLIANPPTATARSATSVADLVLDLSVEPNRPGRNFVTVGVYTTRRPALAPVQSVELSVAGPGGTARTVALQRASNERWRGALDTIDRAGNWRLGVVVKRPGLRDVTHTTAWPVASPFRTAAETGLRRPLEPILRPIAIGGAILLALVLLIRFVPWVASVRPRAPRRALGELRPGRVEQ